MALTPYCIVPFADLDAALTKRDKPGLIELIERRLIYEVEQASWRQMAAELLHEATFDATSLGAAAAGLGLKRADLETWIQWSRGHDEGVQAAYLVRLGSWSEMTDALLLSITADAGSARKAAEALGVPRSTLCHWVRKAKLRGYW
jgi:transcriptional regulator of acetoin/glycerol metabolism